MTAARSDGERAEVRAGPAASVGTMDLRDFLNLPSWRAFDVDDRGRVLAGCDSPGSFQLVEVEPPGRVTWLTALEGACWGRYLPGSRSVVVQHDAGGDERQQLSRLALDPLPDRPATLEGLEPLVHDPRFFHNLIGVLPGKVAYSTNRRNSVDFDLMLLDLESGSESLLYDAGGAVVEAALLDKGSGAALTRSAPIAMSQQLVLVRPGRAPRALTDPDEPGQHVRPHWMGEELLVTTDRRREHTAVARLNLATGRWTELVAAEGRDLTAWPSPDGRLLLVMVNDDGVARLALHDGAGGARLRELALPDEGWIGEPILPDPVWSPGASRLALSFSSPTVPGDVLLVDTGSGAVTRITDSAAPLRGAQVARPSRHRIPAADGREIPCSLYRPPEGVPGQVRGSAVLHIHGGPESQAVSGFNPVIQGLAAAGHTVVVPNVRGSTGYGRSWYSADDLRRRLDSVADLAAVHGWLATQGLDPNRAALWGGSYGGYMVLAGLAFQPRLWAAGVDIVGISSLVTFLENTSAYRRLQREVEYGSLERDRDFLESASPLGRVGEIRAPLFLIHGANDPRVPLTEAQQLSRALGSRGVECELRVYPDEGHGLARRVNRLDAYPRALDFLARHLAAAGSASRTSP